MEYLQEMNSGEILFPRRLTASFSVLGDFLMAAICLLQILHVEAYL